MDEKQCNLKTDNTKRQSCLLDVLAYSTGAPEVSGFVARAKKNLH